MAVIQSVHKALNTSLGVHETPFFPSLEASLFVGCQIASSDMEANCKC